MRRARLVAVEVGAKRARGDMVRHEKVDHQDVGLLDHGRWVTRSAPSSTSAAIGPRGARSAMTSGSRSKKPANCSYRRWRGRSRRRGRRRARASASRSSMLGSSQGRRPAQVPPRHHVREGVVVDRLVVLVGPDDAVDVARRAVEADPRSPVPRRLEQQLAAGRGANDGRRSSPGSSAAAQATSAVMCSSSSPVRIRTSSPSGSRANRGVTSSPVAADSHWKAGPVATARARRSPRGRQTPQAILEHRPGCRRVGRGEEREHEDVGCPRRRGRDSPAPEPARADGSFALVSDARHQGEEREAHRMLRSASPSMTTSAASHRAPQAARCSVSSTSKPLSPAAARTAAASSVCGTRSGSVT